MRTSAWRNHAVDYLLKIDLDEQKLAQSVSLAIQECEKRGRLGQSSSPEEELYPSDIIRKYVSDLLGIGKGDPDLAVAGLKKRGTASCCAVAELIMDPSRIPNISVFSAEERSRLLAFHQNLMEDVAQKLFYGVGYVIIPRDTGAWIYLWNLDSVELLRRFQAKLSATLGEISQMQISLLATEIVSEERLKELRLQLMALQNEFNISPRVFIQYSQFMSRVDYVDAAKRYVQSNILKRITVQDAADAIGITPNYLSSLFKRHEGKNFIDYVNSAKVRHACVLLKNNRYLVCEVSRMLGFDNAYYFTKVFKRYMRLTPTEYQAIALKEKESCQSGKSPPAV